MRRIVSPRLTTYVQGLAGIEWGYRHGGFAANSGFSLAAGRGVDVSVTNWFAYEIARANYQTTRVGGTAVNSLRFGTGPVFRFWGDNGPIVAAALKWTIYRRRQCHDEMSLTLCERLEHARFLRKWTAGDAGG